MIIKVEIPRPEYMFINDEYFDEGLEKHAPTAIYPVVQEALFLSECFEKNNAACGLRLEDTAAVLWKEWPTDDVVSQLDASFAATFGI